MKKILLTMVGVTSLLFAADFTRANGVVTDNTTKLQWQDDYNGTAIKEASWGDALVYCHDLELPSGQTGWRLPNINELTSLIDDTKSTPYIYSTFQEIGPAGDHNKYWSSTTNANEDNSSIKIFENNSTAVYEPGTTAWRVFFDTGSHWLGEKTGAYKVRCVRTLP